MSRACAIVATGLLIAGTACLGGIRGQGAGSEPASVPSSPASPAHSPESAGAPDDAPWQTDEQGRQFKEDKYPKSYPHEKLEGNRLRTVWGFTVDLAGEDEKDFFVKAYRTDPEASTPIPQGPTAAERAEVAESYRFDLKTNRRLRFEPFDQGLPKSGQWRDGFRLADMNGDGLLDIVHGPARKRRGTPVIFLGDGKGNWRRWAEATFPEEAFDYGDVEVADFDGDGHPDLALGMHMLGITSFLNDGAGHFRTASQGMDPLLPPGSAFSSRALAAVDWDADGRVDIVAIGEGPRIAFGPGSPQTQTSSSFGARLYRNLGGGVWEKLSEGSQGGHGFGDTLAVGRLNGDALGFVVGSSRTGSKDVLYLAGDKPWASKTLDAVRPNALVGGVATADFDGDGRDDIALGYMSFEAAAWRSGIDLILQRPQGNWDRRTLTVEEGSRGVTALAAGDLDGDGRPDLVALTGDARVLIFLNAGGAVFTRAEADLSPVAASCRGYHVAVTDIDRDGFGDIVASFAGEREGMAIFSNPGCPGEGSLRAWRTVPAQAGS